MKAKLRKHHEQVWEGSIAPDGTPTTITNLWQFCKEMLLNFGAMYRLANGQGRTKSYKGWTHLDNPKATILPKEYEGFIDPHGQLTTITGLPEFCRQHGLNAGHMHDVYTGKRPSHRGWTRQKE